jgi:hypothetical protein
MARPLLPAERDVILHVLAAMPEPEGSTFRRQVEFASVEVDEAYPTDVDLVIGPGAEPAVGVENPLRASALVKDDDGEYIGGILLWHQDGFLHSFEYWWTTPERPTIFPEVKHLEVEL